jgi:hypothetical protein
VLTVAHLRPDSQFPQPGLVACEIVARHQDGAGREIADITTSIPWGDRSHGWNDELPIIYRTIASKSDAILIWATSGMGQKRSLHPSNPTSAMLSKRTFMASGP